MTSKPEGDGNVVTRNARVTKFPILMLPMRLLIPLVGPGFEKKLLTNMKAEFESGSQ